MLHLYILYIVWQLKTIFCLIWQKLWSKINKLNKKNTLHFKVILTQIVNIIINVYNKCILYLIYWFCNQIDTYSAYKELINFCYFTSTLYWYFVFILKTTPEQLTKGLVDIFFIRPTRHYKQSFSILYVRSASEITSSSYFPYNTANLPWLEYISNNGVY